jgi:hypothetical protein
MGGLHGVKSPAMQDTTWIPWRVAAALQLHLDQLTLGEELAFDHQVVFDYA